MESFVDPLPELVLHTLAGISDNARCCIAWIELPPGCNHDIFSIGYGNVTSIVFALSSTVSALSRAFIEIRLPSRRTTVSFSPKNPLEQLVSKEKRQAIKRSLKRVIREAQINFL
jgi:hypothetical protein